MVLRLFDGIDPARRRELGRLNRHRPRTCGVEGFPSPFARIADAEMRKRFESVQAIGDAKCVLDRIRAFRAGGITKFIAIPLARNAAEMEEQSRLLDAEVLPHANDD